MTYQKNLRDVNCDSCGSSFDANLCPDLDSIGDVYYYTCPSCGWRNMYDLSLADDDEPEECAENNRCGVCATCARMTHLL